MMKIAMTGAGGFLGLHVRAAAKEHNYEIRPVGVGGNFNEVQAQAEIDGADALIHLAGVNRGTDDEVAQGNISFAAQLDRVLKNAVSPPRKIIYANSIQAGNGTVYGTAKQGAGEMLARAAERAGSAFTDVALPNLFGEYGRPFYNSVVATFAHQIAKGELPVVHQDVELELLHAQNAADLVLGLVPLDNLSILSKRATVGDIKRLLNEFFEFYSKSEFPDLSTEFRRDLFNTYRSYTFPDAMPINVQRHADYRGAFFEIVRSRGGTGQTSFSTTAPGITRGEHYHRRKVERFTVLAGEAEIKMRRLFDGKVFTYHVSGTEPKSIDMPTLYSHNIKNVGTETLYTTFWTNDIFDPSATDTIPESVE